jgi:predicted transcriptional regulator
MPEVTVSYFWVMKKMPALGLPLLGYLAKQLSLRDIMQALEIAETTARFLTQSMIDIGFVDRRRVVNTFYYSLTTMGKDLLAMHYTIKEILTE